MCNKFNQLKLKDELLKNLIELKFDSMTPIQENSLPVILQGKDVIAQAKTGSGKTAAFGLGILNSLEISNLNAQALILCPTRELAEQVAKEIRKLARMLNNVKIITLCGGTAEQHQERSLCHGSHIVVGTPGRVFKLLSKNQLHISKATTFVLDEADRMLDMGFFDDIMDIVSFLPAHRQSLLFSATYPAQIQKLSENIQKDAVTIKVDVEHQPNIINQFFYEIKNEEDKNEALLKILGKYKPVRSIVFCTTKQSTSEVAKFLDRNGIYAVGIHGDLMQNERTKVLTKFANRSLSVLVATDVAARGLDIQDLEAVINYDLPADPEIYIHRIGRTGRAGKYGLAFSLYIKDKHYRLDAIEELMNFKGEKKHISEISKADKYDLIPPMQTMYISGGKKDKLRPGDVLGALIGEAKLEPTDVGDINIFDIFSFVAIKNEKVDQAIKKLLYGKIKNRKFKVELA